MISVDHLTKKFGETIAVNNLSIEVGDGEIFGLIGPDGAGKTTTLRVISTAIVPSSGTVRVGGCDVVRESEAIKKMIGYMPQRFALYPDLTVIENLDFFADMFGSPVEEREERAERLLGFARLNEFKARQAQNLSGGMQKKLALAATLMHQPQVLLLDEPTTGVDPVSRREFWGLITDIHLQGVTIVISTPYLDEAERCTRVGLMHRGELIACDRPNRLREGMNAIVLEAQSNQAIKARDAVESNEGVLSAATHGDLLRVVVDRAERQAALESAWRAAGIAVQNLRPVKPRLEDAFVLMLEGKEGKEPIAK